VRGFVVDDPPCNLAYRKRLKSGAEDAIDAN
jgi:hypothetical protein